MKYAIHTKNIKGYQRYLRFSSTWFFLHLVAYTSHLALHRTRALPDHLFVGTRGLRAGQGQLDRLQLFPVEAPHLRNLAEPMGFAPCTASEGEVEGSGGVRGVRVALRTPESTDGSRTRRPFGEMRQPHHAAHGEAGGGSWALLWAGAVCLRETSRVAVG